MHKGCACIISYLAVTKVLFIWIDYLSDCILQIWTRNAFFAVFECEDAFGNTAGWGSQIDI